MITFLAATTWPDVAIAAVVLVFMAFCVWLRSKGGDDE